MASLFSPPSPSPVRAYGMVREALGRSFDFEAIRSAVSPPRQRWACPGAVPPPWLISPLFFLFPPCYLGSSAFTFFVFLCWRALDEAFIASSWGSERACLWMAHVSLVLLLAPPFPSSGDAFLASFLYQRGAGSTCHGRGRFMVHPLQPPLRRPALRFLDVTVLWQRWRPRRRGLEPVLEMSARFRGFSVRPPFLGACGLMTVQKHIHYLRHRHRRRMRYPRFPGVDDIFNLRIRRRPSSLLLLFSAGGGQRSDSWSASTLVSASGRAAWGTRASARCHPWHSGEYSWTRVSVVLLCFLRVSGLGCVVILSFSLPHSCTCVVILFGSVLTQV